MNTATKFTAVYEGGVLRPSGPLPFEEGAKLTITAGPSEPTTIPSEEEINRLKTRVGEPDHGPAHCAGDRQAPYATNPNCLSRTIAATLDT